MVALIFLALFFAGSVAGYFFAVRSFFRRGKVAVVIRDEAYFLDDSRDSFSETVTVCHSFQGDYVYTLVKKPCSRY